MNGNGNSILGKLRKDPLAVQAEFERGFSV